MREKTKIVVFYVGAMASLHRLALAVCETVWDAGANLRVRRIGELDTFKTGRVSAESVELLLELEEIPPATLEDLEWSDVMLFGISACNGEVPLGFDRLIEDAKIRWRAGGLANKLCYVFSPAAIRVDAHEGSPLPLSDLFRRLGGDGGQLSRPTRPAPATLPDPTADSSFDAELAAARALGRRAIAATFAVGSGQQGLSDVA